MAGIGFRLQKILKDGSYMSLATAYLYGAIISTGPWLISIVSIGLLSAVCSWILPDKDNILFRTILVYTYMGTLVFTGPFYMSTTRYLADKMFSNDFSAILPTFKYVSRLSLLATTMISGIFYIVGGFSPPMFLVCIILFQSVSMTWIAMIFLSAARDYFSIIRAFAGGYALGIILGFVGAVYYGLVGLLWGFAAGLFILAVLLYIRVYQEFPSRVKVDRGVVRYWKTLPWLTLCGFAYNASLWVDKVLYWIAEGNKAAPGPFYAPADYDTAFFWAYITIVPALTVFLIRIETSFYKNYADFLGAVTTGASFSEIESRKKAICDNLWLSISRLLKIQGGLTGILVIIAPELLKLFKMPPDMAVMLRFAFLAAFIQALFLIMTIIILYFDLRKLAGGLALLALVLNTVLSWYFAFYNSMYSGMGSLAAFLIALLIGMYYFNRHIKNLIFETFISQGVGS